MEANPDEVYPTIFAIRIDSFGGPSYGVVFEKGKLTYRKGLYTLPTEVNAMPARWMRFWKEIDRTGIWGWDATYDDLGIIDGTGWSIHIKHGSCEVESHGHNAYPEEVNDREPPEPFKQFLKALDDLLGTQVFEDWLRGH